MDSCQKSPISRDLVATNLPSSNEWEQIRRDTRRRGMAHCHIHQMVSNILSPSDVSELFENREKSCFTAGEDDGIPFCVEFSIETYDCNWYDNDSFRTRSAKYFHTPNSVSNPQESAEMFSLRALIEPAKDLAETDEDVDDKYHDRSFDFIDLGKAGNGVESDSSRSLSSNGVESDSSRSLSSHGCTRRFG